MRSNSVLKMEIQEVVSEKGYFPQTTPIENYGNDFIQGVLVGAWDQVFKMIEDKRKTRKELPFY